MSRGSESTKRQREIARKFKRDMEALGWVEFKTGDNATITLTKSKQAQEKHAAADQSEGER